MCVFAFPHQHTLCHRGRRRRTKRTKATIKATDSTAFETKTELFLTTSKISNIVPHGVSLQKDLPSAQSAGKTKALVAYTDEALRRGACLLQMLLKAAMIVYCKAVLCE